jgi:magnesium-transporting ATPase (P-type)
VCFSKGAPEILLEYCSKSLTADGGAEELTPEKLKAIESWCDAFSEQGLRTLALAARLGADELAGITDLNDEDVRPGIDFHGDACD